MHIYIYHYVTKCSIWECHTLKAFTNKHKHEKNLGTVGCVILDQSFATLTIPIGSGPGS